VGATGAAAKSTTARELTKTNILVRIVDHRPERGFHPLEKDLDSSFGSGIEAL
jgi:hypothetical protein